MQGGSGGGKKGSVGQGIMVLLVLLLSVGIAGFVVGYNQKFVPVEMVALPGAATSTVSTGTVEGPVPSKTPAALRKAYFIKTKGWERAGYAIKVYINDQVVGTFQTPDRLEDIGKFCHVGDNKIRFQARALPSGNRNSAESAYLTLNLCQGEKFSSTGYKNAEVLVEYTRNVTDTQDFDDTMDFAIVE